MKELAGLSTAPDAIRIVECGCCSSYHRADFKGDCRDDAERFADPEDAEVKLGKPTLLIQSQ